MHDHKGVETILNDLLDTAGDGDDVTVARMREAMGSRSYGPFLLVPALIEMSPIGGIPGVPTVLAATIVLFAAQMLIGRARFWLPGVIDRRSVSADRLAKAVRRMMPVARWLDRWFHGRLRPLTRGAWIRIAAAACILLALTVPPLELLPFASTGPMVAVAMFGLALLVGDGLLMLVGLALSAAAVAIVLFAALPALAG